MRKGVQRGRREQITHTLPPGLLERIDVQAQGRGMTRAGFINYAISRALDELQQ
ncbi:CopG family transcriptional regulator [bacterium]|nr:CopG family transcriptional regulator [bacterium]